MSIAEENSALEVDAIGNALEVERSAAQSSLKIDTIDPEIRMTGVAAEAFPAAAPAHVAAARAIQAILENEGLESAVRRIDSARAVERTGKAKVPLTEAGKRKRSISNEPAEGELVIHELD